MTGEVKRIQAGQSTTGATSAAGGQQGRVQRPKQIIIKFADLPENMRTKEVRDLYDKDGSGFLESYNAKGGQNEIALMQQAFGVDLSQYKSNITSVNTLKNGTKSGRVGPTNVYWIDELEDRIFVSEGANKRIGLYYDMDYNLYAKAVWNGENLKSCIRYFKNGSTISTKDDIVYELRDKDNNLIATETDNGDGSYNLSVIQRDTLTSGENVLTSETTYVNKHKKYKLSPYESSLSNIFEFPEKINITIDDKFEKTKVAYKLNDKPVQAKPIGNDYYEVTDDKGNIFYISHDGVNLEPESVRNNP